MHEAIRSVRELEAKNAELTARLRLADEQSQNLKSLQEENARLKGEASALVAAIVDRQAILVDPPHGHFLAGSMARYNASMMPALIEGLKAKGYLPQPDASLWRDRWSRAPYRFSVEVNEQLEGNYMASENRLTRIDAHLKLIKDGVEVWNTTPTARTRVPLPNLPGYFSARVALSPARIEEFERLLYDNARSQIDEKFAFALSHMPANGQTAPSAKP